MEKKLKVLLVEDDDFDRMVLTRLVKRNKQYQISTSSSIDEAKEKIAGHNFDLIILDLSLPSYVGGSLDNNGGKKILEYIRIKYKNKEDSRPKIVIVSGFHSEEIEAKPISSESLNQLISTWFHKLDDRQELSEYLSHLAFTNL